MMTSNALNDSQRQPAPRTRDILELKRIATRLRQDVIRLVAPTGQGYVQQGLGAADLFTALYFSEMRSDPAAPDWPFRDRFLLSTAHNTAIFYASLAARGFIGADELGSYCVDGSPLEINASERLGTMIEATCGSLGQGLSVGMGMALSAKRRGEEWRVYVLLGDGEMQEGQVWEAAMLAGSLKLANLCLIIDLNQMQVEGDTENVIHMQPVGDKWKAFGFNVLTIDGHSFDEILSALDAARHEEIKPTCIVAHTLPGKGVPALEGVLGHNLRLPTDVAAAALDVLTREATV